MKKRMACIGLLMMALLTACGGDDIDEFEQLDKSSVNEQSDTKGDDGDRNKTGETDSAQIPERVKDSWDIGSTSSLEIDADVHAENIDNITIYQFNKKEINDDFLKKMSMNLFDGGKYEATLPRDYWSVEEVMDEQEAMQKLASSEEGLYIPETIAKEQESVLSSPEAKQGELNADCVILEEKNANTDSLLQRNARIRGDIDGKQYELFFKETFTDSKIFALEVLPLFPVTQTVCTVSMEGNEEENTQENICDYEDARRQAADFIEKLGYTDLSESYVLQRMCGDENGESTGLDGYEIYYSRNINGTQTPIFANGMIFSEREMLDDSDAIEDFEYTTQEYVRISIDHTGVVSADIRSDMEVGEIVLQNPNIISFEQAQETMRGRLANASSSDKEHVVFTSYMSNTVNKIQLIYLPFLNDGSYTYIPTWVYVFDDDSKQISKQNATMGVSAMDGEIIYLYPLSDGSYTGID